MDSNISTPLVDIATKAKDKAQAAAQAAADMVDQNRGPAAGALAKAASAIHDGRWLVDHVGSAPLGSPIPTGRAYSGARFEPVTACD